MDPPPTDPIDPHEALKDIMEQPSHCLFCLVCNSNITKNAELFKKDQEPHPYSETSVIWVPHLNLSRFSHNSRDTLRSPWFLLAVVLLVLSVTVVWFHDFHVPPPDPPSPPISPRHNPYSKYVPIFSSLFLAILPLLGPLTSRSISYLIDRGNEFLQIVKPGQSVDILKSIVYGGLVESITSLGVVSSAAASGASTLNVLALGLANLFSGLLFIIHKLYELKMYAIDEYKESLGEITKYKLHRVVVVVSFIFFGMIPLLFYGLSFRRTDKVHYKAAVVLVVSLVCIISLSFAKACVFVKPKLRTVAEYTGMAIGTSALSFIASQLVSDMLEKFGFHELASHYRKG